MTIDSSLLQIQVQEGERWRRTLNVTVPAAQVQEERTRVASRLASRLRLPGFRKGRIPAGVMEKRFGSALNQEVLDSVVGEAYREALKAQDLKPISQGEVHDLSWEPEQDLVFSISFDVAPELEITRTGGFTVKRPAVQVTEDEVDRVLERLREQNGAWAPAEEGHPEDGDLVAISVTKLEGGEPDGEAQDYDLILGEGDAIPDVENGIKSLAVGGEGEFTVVFPDDFPNEARRGQEEHIRIHLRERKIRELPELSDDFARSVGDFDDLAALRARVREDLEKEAERQSEATVRGQLLDFVVEANPFDVPASMVDRYLQSVVGNGEDADPEVMARAREQLGPEAERAVRRILAIEQLAESKGLQATDDDVDERVEEIAERSGSPVAQVYAQLQKAGRLEHIEREITEDRVFEFLKGESTIEDAS